MILVVVLDVFYLPFFITFLEIATNFKWIVFRVRENFLLLFWIITILILVFS
jgi:hypothetical protein